MKAFVKKVWDRLRGEGHESVRTPTDVDAEFELRYEDLPVGTLRLTKGTWRFAYAREFRDQHELKPLVAFPDVRKIYESDHLWPFFMARIPGLSQPEVMETITEEGLDDKSDVELLRRFGARTISNPFILQESH